MFYQQLPERDTRTLEYIVWQYVIPYRKYELLSA